MSVAYTAGSLTAVFTPPAQPVHVACTFTNTRKGSLVIVKDAVPDRTQTFRFTSVTLAPAGFDLVDDGSGTGNSRTFTGLDPGDYDVSEDIRPPGWTLTGVACDDGDSTTAGAGVHVRLGAGETVTCRFTNTLATTHLVVTKSWSNPVRGDAVALSATLEADAAGAAQMGSSDASGLTSPASITVHFGDTVRIAEQFTKGSPAAYTADLSCRDAGGSLVGGIVYRAGDLDARVPAPAGPAEVTCTFTNARPLAATGLSPGATELVGAALVLVAVGTALLFLSRRRTA